MGPAPIAGLPARGAPKVLGTPLPGRIQGIPMAELSQRARQILYAAVTEFVATGSLSYSRSFG